MKKIALITVVIVLSLFMSVAAVSADGKGWRSFHGVYEMRATGSCLHSTLGFDVTNDGFYVPKTESRVWGATTQTYGTWTFKRGGTGNASGMNYVIDFQPGSPTGVPPGSNSPAGPKVRDNPFSFPFTYNVTHEGSIDITVVPDIFGFEGMVSRNRKTITLDSVYQFFGLPAGGPAYCNTQRVLNRVDR